jgi:hypothetical protein
MSTISIIFVAVIALLVTALLFFRRGQDAAHDVAILSQLRQVGSDLSKPHAIEFFMYFPNELAAKSIAASLERKGFNVKVSISARGKAEWLALATRSMVPAIAELVRLRVMLTAMSAVEQGVYDGWGTSVVK